MIRSTTLIAVVQLLALSISWIWAYWLSNVFPTATQLPIGAIVAFLLTVILSPYLLTGSKRDGEESFFKTVLRSAFLSSVSAVVIASVIGYSLSLFQISPGRVVVIAISTFAYSSISLLAASAIPAVVVQTVLRAKATKAVFAVLFGIFICSCMIGIMETTFFAMTKLRNSNSNEPFVHKEHTGTYLAKDAFYRIDRDLGIALHSNRQVTSGLHLGKELIWDTTYSSDERGRRSTVNSNSNSASVEEKRRFAMFFGCSYMFGEGSGDSETIPSQFAKFSPDYEAINFGVPGYGTQHMLAILENPALKKEFAGRTGVGFYLYLEDIHEARVIGDMDIVTSFGRDFPCYRLDNNHIPQRRGSFSTGLRIRQQAFEILAVSQTRKYFGLNFPKRSETDYELTAGIITKARNKFLEDFPGSDFFVIRYPHPKPHRKIEKYLQESHVKILDFSDLFDPNIPENLYVGDGHPTPLANQKLGQMIAEALLELKSTQK